MVFKEFFCLMIYVIIIIKMEVGWGVGVGVWIDIYYCDFLLISFMKSLIVLFKVIIEIVKINSIKC